MKKYNIRNYLAYKSDIKANMPKEKFYDYYTRDELIIKFLPLVENIARKFSTSQQASGVLTINDLLQEGAAGLIMAVDRLDWEKLIDSSNIETTLMSPDSRIWLGICFGFRQNTRISLEEPSLEKRLTLSLKTKLKKSRTLSVGWIRLLTVL